MNTYFVFWKKVDGEITELEGRSVQASDVSISDGKLKFWREVGNIASDNFVFSLPVETLVDFHKVEPAPATKPVGQPPKIDCDFVNWTKELSPPLSLLEEAYLAIEQYFDTNKSVVYWQLGEARDAIKAFIENEHEKNKSIHSVKNTPFVPSPKAKRKITDERTMFERWRDEE